MAYYRVVRDDDHRYPPWTPTGYEADYAQEITSSFVNKDSTETFTFYIEVPPIVPPPAPTSYTSTMSEGPPDRNPGGSQWSQYGPPPSRTKTYDDYTYSSSLPTPTTLSTASWPHESLVISSSSTVPASPTPPAGDALPPTSTSSGIPGLSGHQADNSPNRTPMYAAAGVAPVVVVVVGFILFFCLRKRRRQRQAVNDPEHIEEMKKHPKPSAMPYIAPITPPSPPPAVLSQYSLSTPSSYHPPTASSSQPIILGPIPSGNNGAYLTGMDTSDMISMTSAGGVSRQGTIVDRDPFADGRSLEEAPPPYRPSSLPPMSIASTSRNSSLRLAAPPNMGSSTQLLENPFGDPEDDDVSQMSAPTLGRTSTAMSDVSELSYQLDPVVDRSPFLRN